MIRIILLRVLLAWYMIPIAYLIMIPLMWLLSGNIKETFKEINEFAYILWNGE